MVEEDAAAALAVKLMMLLGSGDHEVMPPENWLRVVRLCGLLIAEFRRSPDALDSGVSSM